MSRSMMLPVLILMHVGIAALTAGIAALSYAVLGGCCPLSLITRGHVLCPFCGMIHAHIALFGGRIAEAFSYNALFPLGLPYLFLIIHLEKAPSGLKKAAKHAAITLTAVFAAYGILRNIPL